MTSTAPSKWSDLGIRTLSALVLIPVVLACIWLGGLWFQLFVLLLVMLIAYEWVSIVHPGNIPQYGLHLASALCGATFPIIFGFGTATLAVLGLAVVAGLLVRLGKSRPSKWSYLGVLYVGCPAIALALLRSGPDYGALALLWIFLIVWAADILAYFAGRIIGGPRLAPVISPKKTWAGLGGAVVGSALASGVFAYAAHLNGVLALAVLAGVMAIVEQSGDLFESALKRFYGVKDSGSIVPGHGGVIDRVDGLVAVAVIAALFGLFRDQGLNAADGLLHW